MAKTNNYNKLTLKRTVAAALVIVALGFAIVPLFAEDTYAIDSAFVNTEYFFTISAAVSFKVDIPSGDTFTSNPTNGSSETTDLVFNITNSTYFMADPVVSGSNEGQSATRSAYNFTNTGTVGVNITLHLNESMLGCITMMGGDTFATRESNLINASSNTTVVTDLAPESSQQYWLTANFTSCSSGDSTTRYGTIWAVNEGT